MRPLRPPLHDRRVEGSLDRRVEVRSILPRVIPRIAGRSRDQSTLPLIILPTVLLVDRRARGTRAAQRGSGGRGTRHHRRGAAMGRELAAVRHGAGGLLGARLGARGGAPPGSKVGERRA